jgi:hypothetical protein
VFFVVRLSFENKLKIHHEEHEEHEDAVLKKCHYLFSMGYGVGATEGYVSAESTSIGTTAHANGRN